MIVSVQGVKMTICFLANISLGIRVTSISSDFDESTAVCFNFQPTISGAEDTGGFIGGHICSIEN